MHIKNSDNQQKGWEKAQRFCGTLSSLNPQIPLGTVCYQRRNLRAWQAADDCMNLFVCLFAFCLFVSLWSSCCFGIHTVCMFVRVEVDDSGDWLPSESSCQDYCLGGRHKKSYCTKRVTSLTVTAGVWNVDCSCRGLNLLAGKCLRLIFRDGRVSSLGRFDGEVSSQASKGAPISMHTRPSHGPQRSLSPRMKRRRKTPRATSCRQGKSSLFGHLYVTTKWRSVTYCSPRQTRQSLRPRSTVREDHNA